MSNLSQIRCAREAADRAGVRMRVRGTGNDTTIHFRWPNGRHISVWYPKDGRCFDRDERDLEEVISMLVQETDKQEKEERT